MNQNYALQSLVFKQNEYRGTVYQDIYRALRISAA